MIDRTLAIIATCACMVLVGGFIALSWGGRSTEAYVLFVSGPLVSGVVGLILSRKVNAVQASTDVVKEHVNGMLTGRFDAVDKAIAGNADLAEEIALRPPRPAVAIPPTETTTAGSD